MNKDEGNSENKYNRGSTTERYLCNRLGKHRSGYKGYLAGKRTNMTSFDLMKYDDVVITLIESYPCDNKDELLARERTKQEWNAAHRESNKEYHKQYQANNKDAIRIQRKGYSEANKEKIRLQKKVDYEKNQEKRRLQNKAWYEANKEQICARMKANYEKKKAEQS